MNIAKALYPNEGNDGYFCISDYQPIIKHFGEVLIQVDDNDYQGDTRVLFKKGTKYGFLIFGWGSCSGCDALQDCSSYQEVDALIENLRTEIEWFDSLEELKRRFMEKDWQLDYAYHQEETRRFILDVLLYKEC